MSQNDPTANRNMTQMDDFRNGISLLKETMTEMRIVLAEVKGTVKEGSLRATEDRLDADKREIRISALESFKSRIQGQVALLAFIVGIIGGAVVYRFATGH